MFLGMGDSKEQTWLPHVYCNNLYCTVQPKAKYVPIRKKQKFNPEIVKEKIGKAISHWNTGNPCTATEGIELDFQDIVEKQ